MDEIDTKVRILLFAMSFLFWPYKQRTMEKNYNTSFNVPMVILQVDKATSDIKRTNVRLKKTVTEVIHTNDCFNCQVPSIIC